MANRSAELPIALRKPGGGANLDDTSWLERRNPQIYTNVYLSEFGNLAGNRGKLSPLSPCHQGSP